MKKIKKIKPIAPKTEIGEEALKTTADLLDFIKSTKTESTRETETSINYRTIPSKRPMFKEWKKIDVSKWKSRDFLGYYLNSYKELMGEEEKGFIRDNRYLFNSEKGYVGKCLKYLFDGNNEEFKEFIDFVIPWWMSDESFVDVKIPNFHAVFTVKPAFRNCYISSKTAKPKAKSRKELDNHFASANAWDSFIEDED